MQRLFLSILLGFAVVAISLTAAIHAVKIYPVANMFSAMFACGASITLGGLIWCVSLIVKYTNEKASLVWIVVTAALNAVAFFTLIGVAIPLVIGMDTPGLGEDYCLYFSLKFVTACAVVCLTRILVMEIRHKD